MLNLNYTKLGYRAVCGIANLCIWGFIVHLLGDMARYGDAVGATVAVLFGAMFGGNLYDFRHRPGRDRK